MIEPAFYFMTVMDAIAANVGIEPAERYLNAILKLRGRRERVTIEIAISIPAGATDLMLELTEVIS